MSRILFVVVSGLAVSGCGLFDKLREEISDLTQPISMQAVFIGLEDLGPETGLDLTGTQFELGSTVQAWVYEADTSGISPATGGNISLVSDWNGSVGLSEQEAGSYSASGAEDLTYTAGDDIRVVADLGGERHSIAMRTPYPADLTGQLPEQHSAGLSLMVDLRGQDFDNAVVMVMDMMAMEMVWESSYDVAKPEDPSNLMMPIDGAIFEENSLYAVGVVGLTSAKSKDFKDLQEVSSGMMAGTMVLRPVSTLTFDTGFVP